MRPITFHCFLRRAWGVAQGIPLLIALAGGLIIFSPFILGGWIAEKVRGKHEPER